MLVDMRLLGLIWVTVKRLFNKDHNVEILAVFEGGQVALNMTANNIPITGIKILKYQVTIKSPAGALVGEGVDLIDAFSDAIKTIQK